MIENSNKKVVLITGCSSGFGLRIAARLASLDYYVIATMRNLSKQNDLVGEAVLRGGEIDVLRLDVSDINSIKDVVRHIKEKYGRLDVLVNNAGYGIGGFFEDLTQEEIREQIETNFFGVQNVTREAIPLMREQKRGTIVNISSISGLYALPCFGAYNASKWALEGFSESLYYELIPFGINVCLVEPGVYKTKIFHENRRCAANFFNTRSPYYELSQGVQKRINDHIKVVNRDPEDVAILIEKLINLDRPPFRNIPDTSSKIIYALRRFLPFSLFSWAIRRLMRPKSK
ncbi:MAG: SDR family NAD(P)-dependent oxidoreductase [Candidatus Aceula lacicola]|nr:SDR family NAD(P)-dependent oxidoreductase [Candidatus Aceula lacicola]